MKLLLAAEGNTLDSRIARRFEKADWYLFVDADKDNVVAVPNLEHRRHHDIIPKAVGQGITTIITGNPGPRSCNLISSLNMSVALVCHVTGREAIQKIQKGELPILDAATLKHHLEDQAMRRKGLRAVHTGAGMRGKGYVAQVTPRGHHHLQQLSGRGH